MCAHYIRHHTSRWLLIAATHAHLTLLRHAGADVCIVYLPSEQADAAEAKKMIEAEGRRCKTFAGDLRDRDVCRRVVEETVAELGRLDILVNNAAIQYW